MEKYTKKVYAFLLAVVMLVGQLSISVQASNSFYLDFLRPTSGVTSAKEDFSIDMGTADMSTLHTADNIRFYMKSDSVGANWAVNSQKTTAGNLVQNGVLDNAARVFPATSERGAYLRIYRTNTDFAFSFTAPQEGYYDLTAMVELYEGSDSADIYVNDVYVGKIDSAVGNESKQPLLSVYVKEGELANTLTIKETGRADSEYVSVYAFDFTASLTVDELTGMNATVESADMYIGRKEPIFVKGNTTNGALYLFDRAADSLTYKSSNQNVASVSNDGVITAVSAGTADITVSTTGTGYTETIPVSVRNAVYDHVDLNITEGQNLKMSETLDLQAVPYLSDGTTIKGNDYSVTYTSTNPSVAAIEGNVLHLLEVGNAAIRADVTFLLTNEVKSVTRNISVSHMELTDIEVDTEKAVVQALDTEGVPLVITGYSNGAEIGDFSATGFDVSNFDFVSLNPEILTVDANGICHYVSKGEAQVRVTLKSNTAIYDTADVISSSSKTGRTLFTDEMVAQARTNVTTYAWAQTLLDPAVRNATNFVSSLNKIYSAIPSEGVPRSASTGTENANYTLLNSCPYCGTNLTSTGGKWRIDPINDPWKIQCSNCTNKFPTNDFALLYERGLDENGNYSVELAYTNNQIAVANGEKDALINEECPKKGTKWMVDDGFGWSPSAGTYGTNDTNKWAMVARYHHLLWYDSDTYNDLNYILCKLRDAYLWTGEETYGRAGAILLDRVADVYPGFDLKKTSLGYSASHGGGYSGKILGSIWEHYLAETFVECYDAFYPMYDDEEVIRYLSSKAAELGLDNPKTSADLIRENIENGIVRETATAIYNADICGNFGMQQKVAAKTAAALDVDKESEALLEWLMKPSEVTYARVVDPIYNVGHSSRISNSGGELATKYVNEIDRDGFGNEVGISYNQIWLQESVEVAEVLARYSDKYNLYNNPKFVKMFDTFTHMIMGDGYSLQIGDSGATASAGISTYPKETLMAYNHLKDTKPELAQRLAQIYDYYVGGTYNKYSNLDVYTDPNLLKRIQEDVAENGSYQFESENLTGYGLSALRGGKAASDNNAKETRYDTWMYYGRTNESHAHYDMLSMGIDAYGFNFMPDLGYPEATGRTANRNEWVSNTISHNTVVVDGDHQNGIYTGTPKHFDSTDYVKVTDVEASEAYDATDIYRRTLVTIAANEEVSYTLDFFRIKGGNSHMYSFHTQSYSGTNKDVGYKFTGNLAFTTDDIEFTPQIDSAGNYKGTYADINYDYGRDPYSTDASYAETPKYTRGYTWLKEVNRGTDKNNDGVFAINFKQTDFKEQVEDSTDLNLKFWALNSWTPSSVDVVTGYAPRNASNSQVPGLHYMFIHRTGTDLDTLYTSLLEPYKGTSYIASATPLAASVKSGAEKTNDISKVVKVVLSDRTDYVVYATNNHITYTITDGNVTFDFKGFVGVYSVDVSGNNIYTYVNDGSVIGTTTGRGTYTGTVVDFTKDLAFENEITIHLNEPISDVSVFENQYIYVDNTAESNGAFKILDATVSGNNVVLHLGNSSLVKSYANDNDTNAGYKYTIEEGQSFTIPVTLTTGELF